MVSKLYTVNIGTGSGIRDPKKFILDQNPKQWNSGIKRKASVETAPVQ